MAPPFRAGGWGGSSSGGKHGIPPKSLKKGDCENGSPLIKGDPPKSPLKKGDCENGSPLPRGGLGGIIIWR
ncbi:hypothetical protein LYNGBM3L_69360 [Moorena producens 3L]|uniref:Uncharacterized protein n=1 Tax=Moorena producens 3L TaxID=489825 RepID=F4Y2L1_9CYAN|nr:hypothetical protein LYNGBM3L_69360 [Moorena producens 3L]OLT66639.1 hypothetical protein BI334_17955 [Moorena producens 3L]